MGLRETFRFFIKNPWVKLVIVFIALAFALAQFFGKQPSPNEVIIHTIDKKSSNQLSSDKFKKLDRSTTTTSTPAPWSVRIGNYLPAVMISNPETTTASTQASRNCGKFYITMCAMVYNEGAYLPEWIEFHRLQGVDRFIIYNFLSKDLVEYLPMLYEQNGMPGLVVIEPAMFYGRRNFSLKADAKMFRETRRMADSHCINYYGKTSTWIIPSQVGFYLYGMQVPLSEYLETYESNPSTDILRVPAVCFGTIQYTTEKFKTWLAPNPHTGEVDLLYEHSDESVDKIPLVTEYSDKRAPHPLLDSHYAQLSRWLENNKDIQLPCSADTIIDIVKSGFCPSLELDDCFKSREKLLNVNLTELRMDSHEYRSYQQFMEHSRFIDGETSETFTLLDQAWYSIVKDDIKRERFSAEVQENLRKLKAKIFRKVDRECEPVALMSGQQMMCPQAYPFPYGNNGKYLRECCKTDRDFWDNQLTVSSNTCRNHEYTPCEENNGDEKWWHRSCCIYNSKFARFAAVNAKNKQSS